MLDFIIIILIQKMVMKGDFYVTVPVDSIKLNEPLQKIKSIPGNANLVWVKATDAPGAIYTVTGEHKLVKKVDQVNEKPLLADGDTFYLRQSDGIAMRKGDATTQYKLKFVAKRVIKIEGDIKMIFVVGHGAPKDSLETFLLEGQEQTIKDPLQSLLEIFAEYKLVLDCKSIVVDGVQKLVFALYHPKANAISLLTCVFGKDGFKLIDTYRMKAGVSLTDFSLSQIEEEDSCRHNIMALLVKNGQKLQEVIIGGTDKKQIRL